MEYLSFIVAILLLLLAMASAVIAFIIQKSWATVTLLLSMLLVIINIAAGIYISRLSYQAMANGGHADIDTSITTMIEVLGYLIAPLFIIGLVGFIRDSASIYAKANSLQLENQKLSAKLNQL